MGFLKRRSRLELLALVALLGTIVSIAIVLTGVLHQSRAETAASVTALCRPIGAAITHDDPREVDRRDILRLGQEATVAAGELGTVIKDAKRDRRSTLTEIRRSLQHAGGSEAWVTVEIRARWLAEVDELAGRIGADCAAPITRAEGRAIDQRLKPEQP